MNEKANASGSHSREHTPLKDLTNKDANGDQEHHQHSVTSWHARLSANTEAEFLKKQPISRQQKKAAALNVGNFEQPKQLADQGLEAACFCNLALLQGGPSNGELTLTNPTDRQHETVANMRKDRNQARRERDRARRNRLTDEQKEEMNARRRATRKKKTIDERNARQRQARQNVPAKERQEMNARRRERRKNIPPEERHALLAQRNARLAEKRNTPCAESIAMPCPYAATFHPSTSWN